MKINIVCVGNIKEKYFTDAVAEYVKRLVKWHQVQIIEVAEGKLGKNPSAKEIEQCKSSECKLLEKYLKGKVVLLDVTGQSMDSVQFSNYLTHLALDSSTVTFVIGGSNGVTDEFRKLADMRLSFSKFTYPHQLMRVILVEQIYRATTIANNITYHK